jgi:hypothetical protein
LTVIENQLLKGNDLRGGCFSALCVLPINALAEASQYFLIRGLGLLKDHASKVKLQNELAHHPSLDFATIALEPTERAVVVRAGSFPQAWRSGYVLDQFMYGVANLVPAVLNSKSGRTV